MPPLRELDQLRGERVGLGALAAVFEHACARLRLERARVEPAVDRSID